MITPYICVADAKAAIDWYCRVFAGRVTFEPIVMDDGSIGHAEVTLVGNGRIMISESSPGYGVEPPEPGRGAPVSLHLRVDDVAAVAEAARDAGATIDRGPMNDEYGTRATLHDPFGHRWMLNDQD